MTPMAQAARARYGTIKAFARVIGVSPATAGMICQGRHIHVQTPDDVKRLAAVLDTSYQDVVHLISASYRIWSGHEPPEGWIELNPATPDMFAQVQWERRAAISGEDTRR